MKTTTTGGLAGKTVVITRAAEQAAELTRLLTEQGARVEVFPTIEIVSPSSWADADRAMSRLDRYHWIIFTSVNGVSAFAARLQELGLSSDTLGRSRICAIGPKTAAAVGRIGREADLVPAKYQAEYLVEAFEGKGLSGTRFLLPRAEEAREVIPERLAAGGAVVDVVSVYRTVAPTGGEQRGRDLFLSGRISAVTFTSSSTVRNFVAIFKGEEARAILSGVAVACIGPITADTARAHGLDVHVEAETYTMEGLTEALVRYFDRRKSELVNRKPETENRE